MTPRMMGYIKAALRRVTHYWPPRNEAKRRARIERGKYICAGCEEIFSNKDIAVDHIEPVVDPDRGFSTWDEYISRMFCPVEGLQILCKACHNQKTKEERGRRTAKKRRDKDDNKGRKKKA